jgi:hypothetical protein
MGINYDAVGMFDYVRVASYNTYFGWGFYEKNDIHTLFGEITAWAELPEIYNPEKIENKDIENNKTGWTGYKDIKDTLVSLLDKGYNKSMIQTVLEQISELKGEQDNEH